MQHFPRAEYSSACYSACAIVRVQFRERGQATAKTHLRRDQLNAESTEERQVRVQQRRDRLNAESPEEGQARLQQRRDRLNAESAEETGQATAKA